MKTYELCLYDKGNKTKFGLIDSMVFKDCINRDIAIERVKRLFMFQGLTLSQYGYTLKIKK